YYRELGARTNVFPIPAQAQSPAADVLLALSKYDGVIEELRAASRLPYSRYPINYERDSPWAIMLPDVQLGLQLTDKVHSEPILISHLVRLAMLQLILQPVWEGLAQHRWSDAH